MSAFEEWKSDRFYCTDWDDIIKRCPQELFAEAFEAGRAYQREVDARISENLFAGISKYLKENDAGFDIAKAIREQKIDD